MERRVFTVRDTQRGSQSYMEKRRGRRAMKREEGDRSGQEEKLGSQKGRDQSSQ